MEEKILQKKKCLRCGYTWFSEKDNPIQCPKCKSTFWNKEKSIKNKSKQEVKK